MPYHGLEGFDIKNPRHKEAFEYCPIPLVRGWQQIERPYQPFMWQVKPPGVWALLVRIDQKLTSNHLDIPLEGVDYEAMYDMLVEHKSAILCRLHPNVGLIGIAVKRVGGTFTPLMPGFKEDVGLMLPSPTAQDIARKSEEHPWPEGLLEPSTIGVEEVSVLLQPDVRKEWLKRCPEGLWLTNISGDGVMTIYELLN